MAGHAQLKFVMTECSKTQIRLTGLMSYLVCCDRTNIDRYAPLDVPNRTGAAIQYLDKILSYVYSSYLMWELFWFSIPQFLVLSFYYNIFFAFLIIYIKTAY